MILGGYSSPQKLWDRGDTLADLDINALFLHSSRIDAPLLDRARQEGAGVYAEFATFRGDHLLEKYPDLAPIGRDGLPLPKTQRFLGACPSAPQLLLDKKAALRTLVRDHGVAGVWLDYLHFHCDFELPDPPLDQSCFCDRCLERFERDTGLASSGRSTAERAGWLLAHAAESWTDWKCTVIAGFAAEARRILKEERPAAKLGIFSCPWTDQEYGGALRTIVAEDIDRLHALVDVFSPMVYRPNADARPSGWASTPAGSSTASRA